MLLKGNQWISINCGNSATYKEAHMLNNFIFGLALTSPIKYINCYLLGKCVNGIEETGR